MEKIHFGLKVWSTNLYYLQAIKELREERYFDYIELFVEPKSTTGHLRMWEKIRVPYLLHAPHSSTGFNFSFRENEEQNRTLIKKVKVFETTLNARKIIFHPGADGKLDESIRQINMFKNEFPEIFNKCLIENKPKIGLRNENCLGASCDEIRTIKKETGRGFCFDMSHAMCFAAWAKKEWEQVLVEFLGLKPELYHLCDGDLNSIYDHHKHFGEGSYDVKRLLNLIPKNSFVSIETKKNSTEHLDDFKEDVNYLRKCLANGH